MKLTSQATTFDLAGQFYLSEESVGLNRAEATLPRLQALNPSVMVHAGTYCISENLEVWLIF